MNKLKPNGSNTINFVEGGLKNWALVRLQQPDMIVSRLNNQTRGGGGSVKVYPRAWFEDWFFFLVLQCLEAFQGGKNSNPLSLISFFRPPIPGGLLTLYTSSPRILALHLLIMQVATWVFVSSATFFNLLWVAATKVILFKGHFLINAARSSAMGI